MKIVLAPDSFKGSANAFQMVQAMSAGIRSVMPSAELVAMPMADGGEGTMEILVGATGGLFLETEVRDPLHRRVEAQYGILGDGMTAVIELAEASGLTRLHDDERNPALASTYGTGELILHALDKGFRQFIICLGGSATNDGGAGLLQALGMKLLDGEGAELPRGGMYLSQLQTIDESAFDARARESQFAIACDVRNLLCGQHGASRIYGPQKGASENQVEQLDLALLHYAAVIESHTGLDVANMPGSGAAGGTAAALFAFLDAVMEPGARLVMARINFDEQIRGADWIVTGEGRLDGQTGSGKVIETVCDSASKQGIPVIAVCGSVAVDQDSTTKLGLRACFSIVPGPCTLGEAMSQSEQWMQERMAQIIHLIHPPR
ncbi:glycerate kinase [Paenibacillus endophyticus]|uniref:Glycerate kinase n=1 Tax=Paenibacillus endophyticus TaxID=1294268 RepID=A0A7W5GB49_9BACL|nr:glycerate kinase [Paenibacillus endophyticus]MBB3153008.1 glycerate kinase [Paenibacillus endophyticus]